MYSDAYPMFKRCWDHQPTSLDAARDPDIWSLLLAEHMISRETEIYRMGGNFVEEGGRYPGFYSLDDVEAGRAIFV